MQRIWVFQQNGSGEGKIRGIGVYGKGLRVTRVISIDEPLPSIIDEPQDYLPEEIHADLVLDFLRHPDLSHALATICLEQGVAVVASGKKHHVEGVFSPPT